MNGSPIIFDLPATLRRGDLLPAVRTNGRTSALAKTLRNRLAKDFDPKWTDIIGILGRLWTRKLTDKCEQTYSYEVLDNLLEAGLAKHVAAGRSTEINNLLTQVLI